VAVEAWSCGGSEIVPVAIRWSSNDPSIAMVDPETGEVSGVSAGNARVTGVDEGTYGVGPVEVFVVVVE